MDPSALEEYIKERTYVHLFAKDYDAVNMHGQGRVSMKDFELLRVLGTRAYGKVFLTRKITGPDNGKLNALKQLKKASIVHKAKTTKHTITESQVLEATCSSPFSVTLHYAFQTDSKLSLILDFVNGGKVFTHLNQCDKFQEHKARIYIREVVLVLKTLHELGIIYCDIKLENILLDSRGHIVLTSASARSQCPRIRPYTHTRSVVHKLGFIYCNIKLYSYCLSVAQRLLRFTEQTLKSECLPPSSLNEIIQTVTVKKRDMKGVNKRNVSEEENHISLPAVWGIYTLSMNIKYTAEVTKTHLYFHLPPKVILQSKSMICSDAICKKGKLGHQSE